MIAVVANLDLTKLLPLIVAQITTDYATVATAYGAARVANDAVR